MEFLIWGSFGLFLVRTLINRQKTCVHFIWSCFEKINIVNVYFVKLLSENKSRGSVVAWPVTFVAKDRGLKFGPEDY